ncbi:unnamed protein product [Parajaminaea phylloscopi]
MRSQRRILLSRAPARLASAPSQVLASLTGDGSTEDEQALEKEQQAALRKHILQLPVDLCLEMSPPDLRVVKDELKGYHVFGQWWPLPPVMTGIEEAGIKRLYHPPEDVVAGSAKPIDRRPPLLLLLRSWISTYLSLLSLLQFPPSYFALRTLHHSTSSFGTDVDPTVGPSAMQGQDDQPAETVEWLTTASSHWEHLRTLVINFQEVLNRARRNQAAKNVRALMAQQLERRRQQTERVRAKNQEVRQLLQSLVGGTGTNLRGQGNGQNASMASSEPSNGKREAREDIDVHTAANGPVPPSDDPPNKQQSEAIDPAQTQNALPVDASRVKADPDADLMQLD